MVSLLVFIIAASILFSIPMEWHSKSRLFALHLVNFNCILIRIVSLSQISPLHQPYTVLYRLPTQISLLPL